jgi:hypothetical protein
MLAVLFSLRFLEQVDQHEHVERSRAFLREHGESYPVTKMLEVDPHSPGDGFYGCTYLIGEALLQAVGWELLKPLATMRSSGIPSIPDWLASLPDAERAKADSILPTDS